MASGDKPVIDYRDESKDRAERAAGAKKTLGVWVGAVVEFAIWMFVLFMLPQLALWLMQSCGPLHR